MKLLDLIFPPLCRACKSASTTPYLCSSCWQACEPTDPATRCRRCFSELERLTDLCPSCRRASNPAISAHVFPISSPARYLPLDAHEALAGYLLLQLTRLEWPTPALLLPAPDALSKALGRLLAPQIPCPLSRRPHPEKAPTLLLDASLHKYTSRLESAVSDLYILRLFE